MAITKLSDRELNAKLMESMNLTDVNARKSFEEMMNNKYKQIRQEVRQEVYEELSKQAKVDRENNVEALNQIVNKVIKEEKEKIDIHRKNLIKEKLALKEAKSSVEKEIADKTAMIKEEFNKKLESSIASMKKSLAEEKKDFIEKASSFINEQVKREVSSMHADKKQLGESLKQFSKFIGEQVKSKVQEHREEMKSLESLKVKLVKEQSEKVAQAKKVFYENAAGKMSKFIENSVKRELKEFRQDIAESRKKAFGAKLFEAFAKEFAVKFFNEDKVVKGLLESVRANNNKLSAANKSFEEANAKLIKENKELKAVNGSLTRAKMINENINHLPVAKQEMIKNLVKDVPTNKLVEHINKYIPMVLDNSNKGKINNNRVLRENNNLKVMSGDIKEKRAMKVLESDAKEFNDDIEAQIAEIVAMSKL